MLDMVVENKEMISEVQHKYYFLESLIQLLNACIFWLIEKHQAKN